MGTESDTNGTNTTGATQATSRYELICSCSLTLREKYARAMQRWRSRNEKGFQVTYHCHIVSGL
eukprot:scaffold7921_cov188-Alexandrium_tamarense.AAC.5